MNDIQPENQRNPQARFHRSLLIFAGIGSTGYVQEGAYQAFAYVFRTANARIIGSCGKAAGTLAQLSHLLFQCHLLHQTGHETVHLTLVCLTLRRTSQHKNHHTQICYQFLHGFIVIICSPSFILYFLPFIFRV